MQFKYPELLYALFVLIIPILVHLFQLQRYTKVPFTNVQLLKNIQRETRKSARLKKWLVLISRLFALACLIFAFAQPFTSEYNENEAVKTSLYIDNSLSMKSKGSNGELLREQINAIIENGTYENEHIEFHSNFNTFNQKSASQLKEALIELNYQPYPVNFENELLRINSQAKENTNNRLVILSDFQSYQFPFSEIINTLNSETVLMQASPIRTNNIAIDSIFTSDYSATNITINAVVKSQVPITDAIAITLYNGPTIYGKTTVNLSNNNTGVASFSIPTDATFSGKLSVEDQSLTFDNDYFFTYSIPETVEILSIGDDTPYLRKIFNQESFNYQFSPLNQVNYSELSSRQFIVLNEIPELTDALNSQIREFISNGGHVLVIPSENSDIDSYNKFFNELGIGNILPKQLSSLKVTDINFEHPIFNKVFDRTVENFQYPTSNSHYLPNFQGASSILSFQNNASFISVSNLNNGRVYYVSSALSDSDTNFKESPLIVPIFYNMAVQSHGLQEIQYKIDANTVIDVMTSISQDEVLAIKNEDQFYIPIQKVSKNIVQLELGDQIQESGFYDILKGEAVVKRIALNYARNESNLAYSNIENLANIPNISIANSTESLLEKINESYKINWLFKWFLAFSVLFLFFEMLILKYFKL